MAIKSNIENLFRSNYRHMFVLAFRLVRNEDTARDIVHDVFANILASGTTEVTAAYLLSGVRFACLKHLRSLEVRERFARFLALDLSEAADEDGPDENDLELVRNIVEHLPERTRSVVRLRFAARLSYSEIAQELSISEVAVYKHLRDALNVLRKNFEYHDR